MDAMTTMKTQIVDGGDPSVFLFKMFLAKEDDSEAGIASTDYALSGAIELGQ